MDLVYGKEVVEKISEDTLLDVKSRFYIF